MIIPPDVIYKKFEKMSKTLHYIITIYTHMYMYIQQLPGDIITK